VSLHAAEFLEPAVARGFDFWSGVPCSFLTPFINYVVQSERIEYIGAAVEGEAVALAAGAYIAGRKTVVICQNSGLGNAVSPFTSLNHPFRIPTLFITTHRGAIAVDDEPQHVFMGRITGTLLDTVGIRWAPFPRTRAAVEPALDAAERWMDDERLPYAFVMEKDSVAEYALRAASVPRARAAGPVRGRFARPRRGWMDRTEAIRLIRDGLGDQYALLATTGKIARTLFTLGHRPNQFYVIGSMGYASAVGLGIHEALEGKQPVAVLDGDGAALMHMGVIATIGSRRPRRFVHVILDNEVHDSTGGQPTVSPTVDFAMVARACGYRQVWRVDSPGALQRAVRSASDGVGPALIHVKVARISGGAHARPEPGPPTLSPTVISEEFARWLARG
jgi:phosphonopyruvate decarboxylase